MTVEELELVRWAFEVIAHEFRVGDGVAMEDENREMYFQLKELAEQGGE